VLFGIVALGTAATELMVGAVSTPGWRLLHTVLAVVFAVAGIVGFIHPGDTFVALAAVVSFYLIFRGASDVIMAFSISATMPGWWFLLLTGTTELLLGFWAAGSWGLSVIVLVSWVGAAALLHGLTEIVYAFHLRGAGRAPSL